MKKIIALLTLGLLFSAPTLADTKCFLAKENNKILFQEGDCQTRYTPQSTFKVPLSLMGFDAGILQSETRPQWPFKKAYDFVINVCKESHNPKMWMRDSCVWYSQVLSAKLGREKFKNYVTQFNYGNQDVSGYQDKNYGSTNAWLSSSLEISPEEQTVFLQKLINHKLPVSAKSLSMTKKIMFKEELPGGWKLYGKTGSGQLLNRDKTKKINSWQGWFIGWIEKNERIILFASHITYEKKHDMPGGFIARQEATKKLWQLIGAMT